MLKKAIANKIKKLDPFVAGLASGFGINRIFQKGIAKKMVGKSDTLKGLKPMSKEKRELSQIIHGKDVEVTQKRLSTGVKNVYEKGNMPDFEYQSKIVQGAPTPMVPKRLTQFKGDKLNISKKDKILYNLGKYGPTATAVKAPIGAIAGAAVYDSGRPKRPAQLPDNSDGWKTLDKNASETYIKPKENTMLNNAEFQISFSDELHKISSSDTHTEAVELLKEASPFTTGASKAWRAVKRFAKNPVLKSKKKMNQASSAIGGLKAEYGITRGQRMKGRSQQVLGQQKAITNESRIKAIRESKIRNIDEAHNIKAYDSYKMDRVNRIKDRKKYEPLAVQRRQAETQVRNENLRAQTALKDKNIAKQKIEDGKIEVEKLKANAQAVKNQSILTRVGGGLTSAGTPSSAKTVAGAAAVGVPAYAGYQLTMADKKKKDNSIFKFGGKAKKKKSSAFGMLSVKAGIDNNPKPTAADRIAGAKMKKESYAKPKKKVIKKKVTKKAIKY